VVTPDSPFLRYLFEVYITNLPRPPEATVEVWDEAIAHACQNTWLYDLIKSNKTIADIDQIFSRRFISASPAVQVFTESGVLGKLLGKLTRVGIAPYYIFQCRPVTGVKERFQVPIEEGIRIVDAAKARQNGFGKSVRYAMSHPRGKIEIIGGLPGGETVFKFHQSKDDADMARPFTRVLKPADTWLDGEFNGI